jgi:hypothetical protein
MFLVVLLIGRHQLKLQNQIKIKLPVSKTPNIKNQDSELKMNEISTAKFWINQDKKNSRSDLAFSAQRPIARETEAFNFLGDKLTHGIDNKVVSIKQVPELKLNKDILPSR